LRLYEFQAKKMLDRHGIKTPKGRVAYSPEEAGEIAEELGVPVFVKAQVLVGGRGLKGGVKLAESPEEARQVAANIFSATINEQDVNSVLVEEKIQAETEYFTSITIDYQNKCPLVMASSRGGVDIEHIASKYPDEVVIEEIAVTAGLTNFQARRIAKTAGLKGRSILLFGAILQSLYTVLIDYDAILVEINPLVATHNGSFTAVDAKIILDDNASFRHQKLFSELSAEKMVPMEGSGFRRALAHEAGIPTYVEMAGNIGIISDGAGTGMLTLDLTKDFGGKVGVYCELGGRVTVKLIEEAMRIVLSNENVHVLLVNLFGGLNRMDEMAHGIISFLTEQNRGEVMGRSEIVVRMSGTLEEEGWAILEEASVGSFENIYDAIEKTVELARRD
jgi:succinyl-CoA synthetase beta subunit